MAVRECPACGNPLRQWTAGGVTLDGCDSCGGAWFDGAELQQVADAPSAAGLEAVEGQFEPGLGAFAKGGSGKCPVCRKPLQRFSFPHSPEIELDGCRNCHGIWFDDGELAALAAKLPGGHARTSEAEGRQSQTAAAVSGLVQRRVCARCGTANPELARRCRQCRAPLHEPPREGAGELLSRHRLRFSVVVRDLMATVLVASVLFVPSHRNHLPETLELGTRLAIFGALLALLAWRWAFKQLAVDATVDGLILYRPLSRKFVPWDAIRGGATIDLGTRAPWYPLVAAARSQRHGARWGAARDRYEEMRDLERPKVLMLLYTSRGLVKVGPELEGHDKLVDRIRGHM